VNKEVTNNLESRMQDHVELENYNFTPDEELLDLDLDANSPTITKI